MSKHYSTTSPRTESKEKPDRPEGSPLFWHASGRWAKKILGKLVYFGRGSHADALADYLARKDTLHSGREEREAEEEATVYLLCGKYLKAKKAMRDSGEVSARWLMDCADVCKLLIHRFGRNRPVTDLQPHDFAKLRAYMAKKWGPVRVGNVIQGVRSIFKYGWESRTIKEPVNIGPEFRKPSRKVMRKAKAEKGPRMFEAQEVRAMIEAAGMPLKCMVLLGVNGGFSNSDCGALSLDNLDLKSGWINFAREKTGIMRRVPLWPETVEALKEWLAIRPEPADEVNAGLVFVTRWGAAWTDKKNSTLCKEATKLLAKLEIKGRTYYHLRHTLQTIGDACRDFPAVRHIMGHAGNDIADVYRERIDDGRLRRVTDSIRAWLFAQEGDGGQAEPGEADAIADPKPAAPQGEPGKPRLRLFAG